MSKKEIDNPSVFYYSVARQIDKADNLHVITIRGTFCMHYFRVNQEELFLCPHPDISRH